MILVTHLVTPGTSCRASAKIWQPRPPLHSGRLKGDSGNTFGNTLFSKCQKTNRI
nr:MAG TPA: hypothetical protein [Caudoviricetes sp.]